MIDIDFPHPIKSALYTWLIRHADDSFIISHRLSEWCGHAPTLEEDIALANIASDYLGQATAWYEYATSLSEEDISADQLVFFRSERHFCNICLVELPKYDFAFTILRLFFFVAYRKLYLKVLSESQERSIANLAKRGYRESCYHYRHSHYWLLCLGLGTKESHKRMQAGLDLMWHYLYELFYSDRVEKQLIECGFIMSSASIQDLWVNLVSHELEKATLIIPEPHQNIGVNGRKGFHTEYLGHIIAEVQSLQRSMPEAKWD